MPELKRENLDETGKRKEVRALIKLRCGNLGKMKKYWLDEGQWSCVF